MILFGSQARGDAHEGSDYDVLVVDKRTRSFRESVLDVDVEMMDRHNTLFAALIYDERQWRQAQGSPLAWRIEKEGIAL